ncbi:MAG: PmoA family protein [Verrucomicrobiae bacterium]|nr:PmoA family protein [Verrucomicrobiae bacterium]
MRTRWLALAMGLLAGTSAAATNELTLDIREAQGELILRWDGRPLLVYAFATNQFKPYVRELYTLRGENVLLDAPADHLHHHGLMYAIRVNGVNFWEENDAPGVQKPVRITAHQVMQPPGGVPRARFTQLIHWLAPTNRPGARTVAGEPRPLLIEQRTLTLSVNAARGEVALQWDAEFAIGEEPVTLHGQNYNGLGLRPIRSFNGVARFENSERAPYPPPGQHASIPARWTSMTGKAGDRDVTLALMAGAANPGESRFFTMLEPFAYLSATQGLHREPLEYKPGDRYHLRYLLVLWSEAQSAETVQARYNAWSEK